MGGLVGCGAIPTARPKVWRMLGVLANLCVSWWKGGSSRDWDLVSLVVAGGRGGGGGRGAWPSQGVGAPFGTGEAGLLPLGLLILAAVAGWPGV